MHRRLLAFRFVARALVLVLLTAVAAQADEIKIMTSGALAAALRELTPVFERASAKYGDVTFGKIDTEAEQELAGMVGIQAIPTLMLFRDGVLLFRESGALPPAALEQLVTQAKTLDMAKVKAEIKQVR